MASRVIFGVFVFLRISILFFFSVAEREEISLAGGTLQGSRQRTYIVHVQPPPPHVRGDSKGREIYHRSFLPVHPVDSGEQRLLYSYEQVISGFAARLTDEELAFVGMRDGFVAAYPDDLIPLQTTHTPEFLGLRASGVWNASNSGEGVIIGVLDTGINPDHPSFACDLPPPPATWKGKCDFGLDRCNKKIIGARGFALGLSAMMRAGEVPGVASSLRAAPFDEQGHGTHVASIAAGCPVDGATSYGEAKGTAIGVAPRAYLSIYKVCGGGVCPGSDILAGLDAAINDGVDIASMSIAGPSRPFYNDPIAIGAFSAVAKGIFVSTAAGNRGPASGTLSNEAPWLLTVAASTIDRSIRATVRIGNGLEFDGETLDQPKSFASTQRHLVSGGSCTNFSVNVLGKIVLCDVTRGLRRTDLGQNVLNAGGSAMILTNTDGEGNTTLTDAHVLPASHVSSYVGKAIKEYISSASSPTAAIVFKGTFTGGPFTPAVAYFSSRGPSAISAGIVKPDIAGPGVNVLAAWPTPVGPYDTSSSFYVISGTSMATPHLSGVAALVKASHRGWSPAAIRSALITSAIKEGSSGNSIENHLGEPASPFDMGAGEVNARGAVDAALVYEVGANDYIAYLCGLPYTNQQVSAIAGRAVNCSKEDSMEEDELNYPSFRISLNAAGNFSRQVTRTLTNLGPSETTCTALNPTRLGGVSAAVRPTTLTFSGGEKKQYTVTFARSGYRTSSTVTGFLGWSCNGRVLRTAAVVSY